MPISRNSAGKPHCLPRQGPVQPLYPNESRGLLAPCTPRQGHWPWTHFATYNRIERIYFRMSREAVKRNSTTGTMKTIKIAAGKMHFPTAYFFVFPGCKASGWRQYHCRRACGAAVPPPTRNVTIFFCQKIFACFVQERQQSLRQPFGWLLPFVQGGPLPQRGIVCQISQESSATGSRDEIPGGG